jgi:hypothetical protein
MASAYSVSLAVLWATIARKEQTTSAGRVRCGTRPSVRGDSPSGRYHGCSDLSMSARTRRAVAGNRTKRSLREVTHRRDHQASRQSPKGALSHHFFHSSRPLPAPLRCSPVAAMNRVEQSAQSPPTQGLTVAQLGAVATYWKSLKVRLLSYLSRLWAPFVVYDGPFLWLVLRCAAERHHREARAP